MDLGSVPLNLGRGATKHRNLATLIATLKTFEGIGGVSGEKFSNGFSEYCVWCEDGGSPRIGPPRSQTHVFCSSKLFWQKLGRRLGRGS
eukprot:816842-Amphidinium_carterae.2